MKKPSRCAIALGFVLSMILFFEVRDTITGKKDVFIARWTSWIFYKNSGYAKNIDVKAYLLNDEQAAQLLMHPDREIQQPPQKDLFLKNVNVVLRISNQGSISPWGTLAYSIDGGTYWFKIDIKEIPASNSEKQVYDYVIPVGIVVPFNNDKPPRQVQYKWLSLYTKF